MLIQTERTASGDGPAFAAEPDLAPALEPDEAGTDALWTMAAAVWRRRWWIAAFTVVAAGAAVAFALWLPNYYTSEARVMLPESGGSSMSSLIESVAPGASGLLGGGGGGDYTRYLAILTSRTVAERAVQRFGLVDVYETADKPAPLEAAITRFHKNTSFEVSLEYNHMSIGVRDRSPRLATAMANFLVDELNTENTRLSSESARERRVFVEQRLGEAEAALDSVRAEIQVFQERSGITEPEVQGQALMTAVTAASGAVAQADVYYQSQVALYGDSGENPDVAAARAALAAARGQLSQLTTGGSALLPVPLSELPRAGRQYARLQQEQLIQAQIIEFVRPMYEQAMFSERQTTSAVQVIDHAVVPVKKSDPKRSVIVLGITLSVLVLSVALVAGLALLRLGAPRAAARMVRAEAALGRRGRAGRTPA